MQVRFLVDEDVHPRAAEIARAAGLDVVSVHEIDRRGYTDPEQLAFAAGEDRLLVTRNRDDSIRLTVAAYQSGSRHLGVLIVPYTLPNRQPERIATALRQWHDRWAKLDASSAYLLDFLGT